MTQSPEDRLYRIVEEGLCIGCGLCESVVGAEKIKMMKVANGYLRPVAVGALDDADIDKVYRICPGTVIEGLPEAEIAPDTKADNVWGPWRRMARAYAADPAVRFEGATGGVLTALSQFLLRSGRVEFIYHVRAPEDEPTFGAAHLSFTEADVLQGAGSRYGPTAMLAEFESALARGARFAFVGKPCDIAAARNLAKTDPRVDELVAYWLTPVCGGFLPPEGMAEFLDEYGIPAGEVRSFRYRGRGCPGPTTIETPERRLDLHYLDMWGEGDAGWQLPWRCKICPDGIGEAADIAAADSWVGGSPNRVESETDPGTNAVIARTRRGVDLLAAAEAAGAIAIEYDIVPDEMSLYQPHQMQKKYYVYPRHRALAAEGCLMPETRRLRIKELSEDLPDSENARQYDGTRQRVRAGRGREPRPGAVRGSGHGGED